MRQGISMLLVALLGAVGPAASFAGPPLSTTEDLKLTVSSGADLVDRTEADHLAPRDLRRLAPIQIVIPTGSSDAWEVLGSRDGKEWKQIGVFDLQHGQVPVSGLSSPDTGGGPFSMVSGSLRLVDGGGTVQGVVASVADVNSGSGFLPADALTFVVHDIAIDQREVSSLLARSTRDAQAVPGLKVLGIQPEMETGESQPPFRITDEVTSCPEACQAAMEQKLQICNSDYTQCVAGVTAAFTLCLALCSPTGPGCAACAVIYAGALYACDQQVQSCRDVAGIDKTACDAGCPTGPEEPFCGDADPICTPLVINVDGRQNFRFSSADEGVWFDLDGDGVLQLTAWTEPGYAQAFLALDRNGNGLIDDGLELFGGLTAQPSSDTPNGFRALALFDEPLAGGNGDGLISEADAVFPHLRLWFDENQDGVSQSHEQSSLADEGLVSIDTEYGIANRRDRHGNLLRYRSKVRLMDRATQCVDVFLVQAAGSP